MTTAHPPRVLIDHDNRYNYQRDLDPNPVKATQRVRESDPHGLDAHAPGAKLDAGKPRPGLVLGGFARALLAVTRVGTYGAVKYTDNGWEEVPNGIDRYDDAKMRHWLYEKTGITYDPDTNELHAAHDAWNALARLDLLIRKREQTPKGTGVPFKSDDPSDPNALRKLRDEWYRMQERQDQKGLDQALSG